LVFISKSGNLGRFLYQARRYDEAIEVLQKNLELDPNRVYSRLHLAMCYQAKGMYPQAALEDERIQTHFGGRPDSDVSANHSVLFPTPLTSDVCGADIS
jgi:tetratricopeptide (TPR) repeat protein